VKHAHSTSANFADTVNPPEVILRIDGASRGNPGPAACAVVVETAEGAALASFSKYLGRTTNNFAEYQALLAALEHALANHYTRVRVLTDSELMARQIGGLYRVKSADLKPLHEKACELISRFESFRICHLLREQNREADRLANHTLDAAEGKPPEEPASGGDKGFASSTPPPLRIRATYRRGALEPNQTLPLMDGEEVELEIHRKK
jgi:ribonuclease HI